MNEGTEEELLTLNLEVELVSEAAVEAASSTRREEPAGAWRTPSTGVDGAELRRLSKALS